MSHPFGDLVSQHLHRKHGLSQSKLAAGILQAPTVITAMCKGKRLIGPQARERVVAIIDWLNAQGALDTLAEANALLDTAGMSKLNGREASEARLAQMLQPSVVTSASPSPVPPKSNLPTPASSLIGREADIAAVRMLLRRDGVRLVSLLGPPGVGKTRLAIESTREACDDFADGTWFVALAPVTDPELVTVAIAQSLGIPLPPTSVAESVKHYLRNKQLLLVLDNLEQLLGVAPLVADILATSPQVKVLATSRATLHISGEHEFEVKPLAAPPTLRPAQASRTTERSPDEIAGYPAVELFVQRTQAIKPDFALTSDNAAHVAEVCRRLDGLPLAIELAAARGKIFSPQALLERLSQRFDLLTGGAHDLPQRQRTLRDTIDWSYHLLSADEQTFWRRLSIFAGGFMLDAAEHVAGHGLRPSAADVLQSLLDQCLVHHLASQAHSSRYFLLETLREYALERLEDTDEAGEVCSRHAAYFAAFAESIEATAEDVEQSVRFAQYDVERDNLQAALTEARQTNDALLQMRFVAAAGSWLPALPDSQGWAWLQTLLKRPETQQPSVLRARALYMASTILLEFKPNFADVSAMVEESTALFHDLGETIRYGKSLALLSKLAWITGEFALAERYCEQSFEACMQSGNPAEAADALEWWAATLRDQGQFEKAIHMFNRSLDAYRQLNSQIGVGGIHNGMGDLAYSMGDYATAARNYEVARQLWLKAEVKFAESHTARGRGRVAYAQGDVAQGELLLGKSIGDARQHGHEFILNYGLHHLAFVKHMLGDTPNALALLSEAIGIQYARMSRMYLTESLERFAWIAADTHQPQRAARLFGAAETLREWMGAPLPLGDKPLYDRYLVKACAELDETSFSAAWADGRAMSLDQAVAYALGDSDESFSGDAPVHAPAPTPPPHLQRGLRAFGSNQSQIQSEDRHRPQ